MLPMPGASPECTHARGSRLALAMIENGGWVLWVDFDVY